MECYYMAEARGSVFFVVRLRCGVDVHEQRALSPNRRLPNRRKMTGLAEFRHMITTQRVYSFGNVPDVPRFELDVSHLNPDVAAMQIVLQCVVKVQRNSNLLPLESGAQFALNTSRLVLMDNAVARIRRWASKKKQQSNDSTTLPQDTVNPRRCQLVPEIESQVILQQTERP